MPPVDPPHAPAEPPCCAIAEQLTPARLETLEACLRGFGGAQGSIRKLALQFGVPRTTLAAHKRTCLGLAPPIEDSGHPVGPPRATVGPPAEVREIVGLAGRPDVPKDGNQTRARARAKLAGSREERIAYLTRRLATGKDAGWLTYSRLSEVWGVSYEQVHGLSKIAAQRYAGGQGDTTQMVARSLAMNERVQRAGFVALGMAHEQKDPRAQAAALSVVQKAQAGKDKAAGLGGGVMGRIVQSPEFQLLIAELRIGLLGIPGAWETVQGHMAGVLTRRRAGSEWAELVGAVEGGGEGRG